MTIHPPYWFADMQDPSLQLLIEHQGKYGFLDVNLRGCKAGRIVLNTEIDGERITFSYELKERNHAEQEKEGFTQADVIYLLMPDRFGGSFEGIIRQLPYLADLGVTALWLTPVQKAMSYHGYDTTDYYSVQEKLGTLQGYCKLVEKAHELGLKVIMDMVFNHCGSRHPWMSNPPEEDWFNHPDGSLITNYRLTPTVDPYASEVDLRQTVEGWFVKTMPDLNIHNARLLRYLTQCTKWWIETAGIDGIRMDTFPYAAKEQMEQWLNELHGEYPGFHVVGETWVCNPAFTAKWQEGPLDSTMDFALFEAFNYAKYEDTTEWWNGMNRIYHVLCYDYLYPTPAMTMAFLDNHDVNRFLGKDTSSFAIMRLKASLAILLTIPRIPQIYYGTEALLGGTTEKSDNDIRQPFRIQESSAPEAPDMHSFMRRLLNWRKACQPVISGSMKHFIPFEGIYVIVRVKENHGVILIVNGRNAYSTFRHERYVEALPPEGIVRNVMTGRRIGIKKDIRLSPNRFILAEW